MVDNKYRKNNPLKYISAYLGVNTESEDTVQDVNNQHKNDNYLVNSNRFTNDANFLQNLSKGKCGRALAEATMGLRDGSSIDQEIDKQTQSLSTFANEKYDSDKSVDDVNSNQIFQSIAKATIIKKINQKQLSYQASLDKKPDPSNAIVLIHIVDRQDKTNKLGTLRENLARDDWYVASGTKVVKPTEKSCTEHSSVRFFNSGDSSLAEELKQDVNKSIESINKGNNIKVNKIKNDDKGVVDLSDWKYSASVPDKTLELWLTITEVECKKTEK